MNLLRVLWNAIKGIATLAFAALGVMTNVTPGQAESNLSAWFTNPPQWLRAPSVDAWVEPISFLLAFGMCVWLVWPWIRRQFKYLDTLPWLFYWPFGHIPINQAAQIAYQQTWNTPSRGWAVANADRGNNSVLATYVKYIGRYTSVKVFGIREKMNFHEEIPKGVFKNDDVEIHDDSLIHLNKPSEPLFTKLVIRRRDLAKAIEELRKI